MKRGFTLIELLVVVSIIAFLSSIIITATNIAKAKGQNAAVLSQVHQYQAAAAISAVGGNAPDPGDSTNYYCMGKLSSETCTFWGVTFTGNDTVTNATIRNSATPAIPTVVIDGLGYDDVVYKCKSRSSGSCDAAVYLPQSLTNNCTTGTTVVSGSSGGSVCGQDVIDTQTTNVESQPGGKCGKCM